MCVSHSYDFAIVVGINLQIGSTLHCTLAADETLQRTNDETGASKVHEHSNESV